MLTELTAYTQLRAGANQKVRVSTTAQRSRCTATNRNAAQSRDKAFVLRCGIFASFSKAEDIWARLHPWRDRLTIRYGRGAAKRKLLREAPKSPQVFISERRAPLSAAGYQRMVARAGVAAKFTFPVHSHMLRHACGFKLANDGHDQFRPAQWIIWQTRHDELD
jgi:hypothetical protein